MLPAPSRNWIEAPDRYWLPTDIFWSEEKLCLVASYRPTHLEATFTVEVSDDVLVASAGDDRHVYDAR